MNSMEGKGEVAAVTGSRQSRGTGTGYGCGQAGIKVDLRDSCGSPGMPAGGTNR